MRVLMIEDNEHNAYLAQVVLEKRGHTVVTARTGSEGVTLARAGAFDVVLLDLRLPDGDGVEFARAIRETGTPMIAVSAHALVIDQRRATEAGCSGFIEKPIDVASFTERIEEIVTRHA